MDPEAPADKFTGDSFGCGLSRCRSSKLFQKGEPVGGSPRLHPPSTNGYRSQKYGPQPETTQTIQRSYGRLDPRFASSYAATMARQTGKRGRRTSANLRSKVLPLSGS